MLVINPELRWSIQEVLQSLDKILDKDSHHVEEPQATSLTDHFPPLWGDDEFLLGIQRYSSTQPSTHSHLTSSAHLSRPILPRDPELLTDAAGPKHDMGQFMNAFADYTMPSRSSCPARIQHTCSTTIAAGPIAPKDDDILQKSQSPDNQLPESPATATTGAPRKEHSLPEFSECVSDQIPDPPPDMDLLRAVGNICVSQKPDLPSTPATSPGLASTSKTHSTCTEEPRPSMSSRTDESMLNFRRPQPSHGSDTFHPIEKEGVPKPEVPALSLPAGDTILSGAKRTETSRGSGATETHSWLKYGLVLWRKLRSMQKKGFQFTLKRGRRLSGRGGRETNSSDRGRVTFRSKETAFGSQGS